MKVVIFTKNDNNVINDIYNIACLNDVVKYIDNNCKIYTDELSFNLTVDFIGENDLIYNSKIIDVIKKLNSLVIVSDYDTFNVTNMDIANKVYQVIAHESNNSIIGYECLLLFNAKYFVKSIRHFYKSNMLYTIVEYNKIKENENNMVDDIQEILSYELIENHDCSLCEKTHNVEKRYIESKMLRNGQIIKVKKYVYYCENTGEEYMTGEMWNETINMIRNKKG